MGRKPTEKMCRTVEFILYWLEDLDEPDMESFEIVWNFIADYLKKLLLRKKNMEERSLIPADVRMVHIQALHIVIIIQVSQVVSLMT